METLREAVLKLFGDILKAYHLQEDHPCQMSNVEVLTVMLSVGFFFDGNFG